MPDRKKVGDVDPAGKKAFEAANRKAREPAKPAAPAAKPGVVERVANKAVSGTRRIRDIVRELGDALDPDTERQPMHDGKTVDEVVQEAVEGVKKNPTEDY